MKAILGAALMAAAVSSQAALLQLQSGTLNASIPDANINGFQNTLSTSGQEGWVTDVDVKLNISGGYNGDLYVYLTHSSGFSVLLNRVGRTSSDSFGYGDAGFNVTFSDQASSDIHTYGGNGGAQVLGSWQPDARNVDPAGVTSASARTAFLDAFNNLDPNGTWTLFIADMSAGDVSSLVSWELDVVTAVPEPTHIALGLFGLGMASVQGVRWYSRRRKA